MLDLNIFNKSNLNSLPILLFFLTKIQYLLHDIQNFGTKVSTIGLNSVFLKARYIKCKIIPITYQETKSNKPLSDLYSTADYWCICPKNV